MKTFKRTLAGISAVMCTLALAACGDTGSSAGGNAGGGDAAPAATTAAPAADATEESKEVTTTTAATVQKNTETLSTEQEEKIDDAASKLRDVELENNEIKWLCHWDINPDNTGKSMPVDLSLFQTKYNGVITWYPTTWENRYNDLSTYVLGGEGIDFFQRDETSLPKGVVSGMFEPIDDYIDINSSLYDDVRAGMDIYSFNNKHYAFVKSVVADSCVIYSKKTIEENGLDDPWELYENGEWNWDTFSSMLEDFCDAENGYYGLDGWWSEKPLYLSGGVPAVSSVDGTLTLNLNDPQLEKAMNWMTSLYTKGLVLDKSLFDWSTQVKNMGEGKELFFLCGTWTLMSDPSTWECQIPPEDVDWVPIPNAPDADIHWAPATCDGFCLCKGAANPLGVALYVECALVAAQDEGAMQVNEEKQKTDFKWTDELIAHYKVINENAAAHPIIEIAEGCIDDNDIQQMFVNSDTQGLKSALHGVEWSQTREEFYDLINTMVTDMDSKLKSQS
jgi:hypothetical protein